MSLNTIITTHLAHLHDHPGWDFETARDELVEAVEREVRDSASSQVRACFWAAITDRIWPRSKRIPAAFLAVGNGDSRHHFDYTERGVTSL